MARCPTLRFDRGTLILHPPPPGKGWIDYATWDDRIEKFRVPALAYRSLLETLRADHISIQDEAAAYTSLSPHLHLQRPKPAFPPYAHQTEALDAWKKAGYRGVVVLPTGAGKSYVAELALGATPRSTLIVVPTLDLMHQWYTRFLDTFPQLEVGLLGGGSRDRSPLLIATYDSAAIHAESLGNQYGLLIFDECHHLPSDFNRVIAEYSLAPYRLGLTATPDRSDGRHRDLDYLIGPEVYRKDSAELAGIALAPYRVEQIKVQLTPEERDRYQRLIQQRNQFLRQAQISLGSLDGWQRFVQVSARSAAGRQAMLAHHDAKRLALATEGKFRVLEDLLDRHYPEQVLIFTNDNATVYQISETFLIPAITHQTAVKERHGILQRFRDGDYPHLVVANVLDEGVDVPEVRLAIFLAGTGSTRQFIQRLGRILRRGQGEWKQAILYEVVAEDTVEEGSSRRRNSQRSSPNPAQPSLPGLVYGQPSSHPPLPKAAERSSPWGETTSPPPSQPEPEDPRQVF